MSGPAGRSSVLSGVVVTPTRLLDDGVVEVVDGRLGYVGPYAGWHGTNPQPVGLVVPGYVDVHCHGGGGHAVTATDPAEIRAVAEHHLARGTTTQLASLVSAPAETLTAQVDAIAGVVDAGDTTLVGSHLEGPWLSHAHRGAHDPDVLADPDAGQARGWLRAGRGTVRVVTLAPERPGVAAVAAELERAGVVVALGHTGAAAGPFAEALRARRTPLVTHLFNGMPAFHHREPGPAGAALAEMAAGRADVELIADGVHVADPAVALVFAVDPGRHVLLVSDAMAAAGLPDGDYELGALAVRVEGGVARIGTGSIAGGTGHLADVVRRCVVHAGVDPVAAVAAASATPARLLGLADRGELASGRRADLLVLTEDWRVARVMRGGAWIG